MAYNLNLNQLSSTTPQTQSSQALRPVRVVDIILDDSHPSYVDTNSIGAVHYNFIDKPLLREVTDLPLAFNANAHMQVMPLKNEVVLIFSSPSTSASSNKSTDKTTYYHSIVSVWNTPNHNASPATNAEDTSLGEFEEADNVNPLFPFSGDILIEGRQGQSLRFTGNKSTLNPLTDDQNNTKPLVILSNGQKDVGNGVDFITEDINEDFSSIYLTSDHKIKLKQVRTKADTFKSSEPTAENYRGTQILVNSGRLFFNAKEDSIFHTSKKAFGVSSETVNLDAEKYIGLDGEKIYLGNKALVLESQPVILGNSLEVYLQLLINALKGMTDTLITAKTVDLKPLPSVNLKAQITSKLLQTLLDEINPGGESSLKSKKVFTE